MKKRVTGAAVIASMVVASGAAQAATIYKKDGLTYKIKGDWQIQLRQDQGIDQDLDVEYDDLELKNYIGYDLYDNLTAFGELDYGFKNAADKNEDPHLEEAYLGFAYSQMKFMFGKTNTAGDEFGVAGYKETVVADDVFDDVGATDGDDLLKVTGDFDMVSFIASYELSADSEDSSTNGTFYDIWLNFHIGSLSIAGAYQNFEEKDATDDIDMYGISASYDAGFMTVAADYSTADDVESIWNVFVAVPIPSTTFTVGGGYQVLDFDSDEDDIGGWYANVIYKFPTQKNVRLFAEICDDDSEGSDMGFLAGMRLLF